MLRATLLRSALPLLFIGALPAACMASPLMGPPAPILSPSATPSATIGMAPIAASGFAVPLTPWVFGAIQELKTVLNQRQIIFQSIENPALKNYGLAANYFLKLGGQWYLIDFEDSAKYNQLQVGQTVNLQPADWASCDQNATETPVCYRMMHVYRGSQPMPPITGF